MNKNIFPGWPVRQDIYIPLRAYIDDIERMRRLGPWRLPIRMGDRMQLLFLRIFAKVSWFSEGIFFSCPYSWSPGYQMLLVFLYKQGLFQIVKEKQLPHDGYFAYFLRKGKMSGQGIAREQDLALSKAIGEMLERMVSGIGDRNMDRVIASPSSLGARGCAIWYPPRFHRFLNIQRERFSELRVSSSDLLEWVFGENLVTGQKVAIPRQITSWFSGTYSAKEPLLLDKNSSGCSGYFTRTGAILRGLLEVVNRDGFLVHWLTMTPPRVIAQETIPDEMKQIVSGLESRGIKIFVLDVTALDIPSVYIAGISLQEKVPQIVLSGASDISFGKALGAALEEMVLFFDMFYKNNNKSVENFSEPFVSRIDKNTRQSYWCGEKRVKEFQWFLSGQSITYTEACQRDIREDNDKRRLSACINRLKKRGSDYCPIVYFPQHPVLREVGFHIAQVYIPMAFPLYLQERYGTFESDRLQEFAVSQKKTDWQLNPLPHMFS